MKLFIALLCLSGAAAVGWDAQCKDAVECCLGDWEETFTYKMGPAVSNSRGKGCSTWYGSLENAKARCSAESSCVGLHDWGADGKNWRICGPAGFIDQKDGPAHSMHKVRTGHKCVTPKSVGDRWIYVKGDRVNNYRPKGTCSTWYGSLEKAEARCNLDANCIGLHDWQADGKNWRTCTSFNDQFNGGAHTMTKVETKLHVMHKKVLWVPGGKAANSHSQRKCSKWYGTLEDAQEKCSNDPTCVVLHDWNADGKAWRTCSHVTYSATGGADTMIQALEHRCYKDDNHPNKCSCQCDVNPVDGFKQMSFQYIDGGEVANTRAAGTCSKWYGSLKDAQARCNQQPDCVGLHDWNADGKNWRTCIKFTAGKGAHSMLRK